MNFDKKIDVLLTTYNSNIEFLKKQIDSILNQTYKNIHLIISDDASQNPEIAEILKEYENKDNRITVFIQEQNLGYLKNFEFLLNKSDGDYIAFADHDDIWYEYKLEKSLKILKDNNADLVYCNCKHIDASGNIINDNYFKYKNLPIINGKDNILAFSRHIAIGCSSLFTKKIKEQMIPFTSNTIVQDWQNVYLASKQNGVRCIEEPLFEYRIHSDNQFGGRSLKQNLTKWKEENGKSYEAFKKYRNERVIKTAYLDGCLMCKEYGDRLNIDLNKNDNKGDNKKEEKVIEYYKKLLKTNVMNLDLISYHKYLSFRGIGKRKIKEIVLFHFPLLSYLVYRFK